MPTIQSGLSYPGSTHTQSVAGFPSHINGVPISFMPDEGGDSEFDDTPTKAVSDSPPEPDEGPRYMGYFVNGTSSPVRKAAAAGSLPAIPAFGDLGQTSQARRRLSTDQSPQSILDRGVECRNRER